MVILTGPFLSANHDHVKNNMVELEAEDGERSVVTFETLFSEKITGIMEAPFSNTKGKLATKIVLVPSTEDAFHTSVFPQPPYEDRIPGGGKEMKVQGAEGMISGSLGIHYVESAGREGEAEPESRR